MNHHPSENFYASTFYFVLKPFSQFNVCLPLKWKPWQFCDSSSRKFFKVLTSTLAYNAECLLKSRSSISWKHFYPTIPILPYFHLIFDRISKTNFSQSGGKCLAFPMPLVFCMSIILRYCKSHLTSNLRPTLIIGISENNCSRLHI